jgi:hypothetical protein
LDFVDAVQPEDSAGLSLQTAAAVVESKAHRFFAYFLVDLRFSVQK